MNSITAKPDSKSGDFNVMEPYFEKVDAILGGLGKMKEGGEKYLPKFPDESDKRHEFRVKTATLTNVFRDICENLAQRPFAKEVVLKEGTASTDIEEFSFDVDGTGRSLHSFAGDVFFSGIAFGIDWILVDYTKDVPTTATVAEERAIGARPYWVRYPAQNVVAAYSDMIAGVEQFVHVRLLEHVTEREGFEEKDVLQVRVFDREQTETGYGPVTVTVWRKMKDARGKEDWQIYEGTRAITLDTIPLVPFMTGRRTGAGQWQINPPMRDAVDLQVELYQQQCALKNIKSMTAFPMLSASGVTPEYDGDGKPKPVPVGPTSVLYAPPSANGWATGSWGFIEPSGTSMRFLADDIADTIRELRELGRQPLTAQSGNLTVVTTAVAAQKGNAAIQAWALNLSDALERCLLLTALWLKDTSEAEVVIDTDFDLGFGDDESFAHVISLGTGDAPLISREAVIHEAVRRGILDRDFNADDDADKLLSDTVDDTDDTDDTEPRAGVVPLRQ